MFFWSCTPHVLSGTSGAVWARVRGSEQRPRTNYGYEQDEYFKRRTCTTVLSCLQHSVRGRERNTFLAAPNKMRLLSTGLPVQDSRQLATWMPMRCGKWICLFQNLFVCSKLSVFAKQKLTWRPQSIALVELLTGGGGIIAVVECPNLLCSAPSVMVTGRLQLYKPLNLRYNL